MKIGFIGAGRVGCSLGRFLSQSDKHWQLMGYYSKTAASAVQAAEFTGSAVYDRLQTLVADCEVICITTSDGVIAQVWEEICALHMACGSRIFLHCSGALSSELFAQAEDTVTVASLHPFYAVSDRFHSYETIAEALFTLEGKGARLEELQQLLTASGLTIQPIHAADKTAYHAAASIGANLMVALAEVAIDTLTKCGFDRVNARKALAPLMQGNLQAVLEQDTAAALTGPAERADVGTIRRHLQVLQGEDREIYRLLTGRLIGIAKRKNPDRSYEELAALLETFD